MEWQPRRARPQGRARGWCALFHKVVLLALILASTSAIRRQMLDHAGIDYEAVKPEVDEALAKTRLSNPAAIAA